MTAERLDRLVARMQDAALERAVLGDGAARPHLALAGALEAPRRDAAVDPPSGAVPVGALLPLLAVQALSDADDTRPSSALGREAAVRRGAALACRRLDRSPESVARAAGVSPEAVRAALERV